MINGRMKMPVKMVNAMNMLRQPKAWTKVPPITAAEVQWSSRTNII